MNEKNKENKENKENTEQILSPRFYSVMFSNNTKLITCISPNLIKNFAILKAKEMNVTIIKICDKKRY